MTGHREYRREVERLLTTIRDLVSELERGSVRGLDLPQVERRLGETRAELAEIVSRS